MELDQRYDILNINWKKKLTCCHRKQAVLTAILTTVHNFTLQNSLHMSLAIGTTTKKKKPKNEPKTQVDCAYLQRTIVPQVFHSHSATAVNMQNLSKKNNFFFKFA